MLSNAGLNTHSNRTAKVELKEDDKDSSFMRKTEYVLAAAEELLREPHELLECCI